MSKVTVDFSKLSGKIKPMNAVNNGPFHKEGSQSRSNLKAYTEAKIPYARNHDAAFCARYGGSHTVDVHNIFPVFENDPLDPASYDFTLTDEYCKIIESAGTKVFYRLGSKIEHEIKKYGTVPPKDFNKWAVICEHIIRHYTEGWADGFHMDIEYWEIWNEPDLGSITWGGTPEEFYNLYTIASKHLKKCFPNLKIGGPATAGLDDKWLDGFFSACIKEKAPIDFFSWHIYTCEPENVKNAVLKARALLDKYGYEKTESILNEWNYVRGWSDDFIYSIKQIIGIKGAAFAAAVMCVGQNTPVDMLMYYDARPGAFNGLFDFYTMEPLKSYHVFKFFARIKDFLNQAECICETDGIYALSSKSGSGAAIMIAYYSEDDSAADKKLELELLNSDFNQYDLYVLDDKNDGALIRSETLTEALLSFNMKANSVIFAELKY